MSSHINNPNEYYSSYIPNGPSQMVVEFVEEPPLPNSKKLLSNSSSSLIELDIWKLSRLGGKILETNLQIDEINWEIFSIEESESYQTITLEKKVLLMNTLISIKQKLSNFSNICIGNILLAGFLNTTNFGISGYNVIRILAKDENLNTIELTILEKDYQVVECIYNNQVDMSTTEFNEDSSVIPKRPIYTLEYNLEEGNLGLVLSCPSGLDIYGNVNLIGNQFITPNIKAVVIYTKDETSVEIYMNNYDCKYNLVASGKTNAVIDLSSICQEAYIKKNIIIKICDFKNNNELYLSKLHY